MKMLFTYSTPTGYHQNECHDTDGGYLVPDYYKVKRPGFLGWIFRLFNNKSGWREVNFYEQLMKRRDETKFIK